MWKYIGAAAALKLFSCGTPAKRLYRFLGNVAGAHSRGNAPMPGYYLDRIKSKVDLCQKYDILKDGDRVLELGTGWVHWEAITLKLFWDIEAVLYDVWDNRQFGAMKAFLRQVDQAITNGYSVQGMDMSRGGRIIQAVLETRSFEELYELLDFHYVVEPAGTLEVMEETPFRLIVSAGVFEHIYREILPGYIERWSKLLAPGGFAIHSINITDHLAHYDPGVSLKQYLSYSERRWKSFFENDVQYINRLQRSEWLKMFAEAGLNVSEEQSEHVELGNLKIHKRYAGMDLQDLKCATLGFVLQKMGDKAI